MESNENNEGLITDNTDYNEANILQLRLSTDPILHKLELYLKGAIESFEINSETGNYEQKIKQISNPKANLEGIHGIMGWIQSLLNSQVVQGNTQSFDHLNNYLVFLQLDLSEHLMKNRLRWDINLLEFEGLIDMIMSQLRMFLSRTVGDGERRSYASTIKHSESNTNNIKQTGMRSFGLPGFGR